MKKLLLSAAILLGTASMNAQVDPATYAPVGEFSIENLWLKTADLGSNLCTEVLLTSQVRGMAAQNGKLYFSKHVIYTEDEVEFRAGYIEVYDGLTGEHLESIKLSENVSKTPEGGPIGFPVNDIQFDTDGNCLVSNLCTNLSTGGFYIWKVDLSTGDATEVLHYVDELCPAWRIDCFGIYGSIESDGYIMAAFAGDTEENGGDQVIKFDIEGGNISDNPTFIPIDEYAPAATGNSTAPRVCPLDENLFYLDGNNSYATLYNMDGTIAESLADAPEDCQPQNPGNNGVDEFVLGDKNFVIYIAGNNLAALPQPFYLCSFDIDLGFSSMQKYWTLPESGMGAASNANRIAIPRIETGVGTKDGETVEREYALIYLYCAANGVGAYRMWGPETDPSSIGDTQAGGLKVITTAEGILLSEAATVEVYTFIGQKITEVVNTTNVALTSGQYIVKATTVAGQSVATKVIVK